MIGQKKACDFFDKPRAEGGLRRTTRRGFLLLLLLFDADLLIEADSDDLLLLLLFDVLLLFDASLRLLISEDLSVEAVLLSLLPPFYQPAQF